MHGASPQMAGHAFCVRHPVAKVAVLRMINFKLCLATKGAYNLLEHLNVKGDPIVQLLTTTTVEQ